MVTEPGSGKWWREKWGLPGEDGLGAPCAIEHESDKTIALFAEEQWVPAVWESMEGGCLTTADAPSQFATISVVDLEKRSLTFSPAAPFIRPGRPLYFYDPDWKRGLPT